MSSVWFPALLILVAGAIAYGAVMAFAVTVTTEGFNINTAGLILLWAGVVAFVIGLTVMLMGSQRRSTSQSSVQQTPTGEVRTEERIDSGGTPIA